MAKIADNEIESLSPDHIRLLPNNPNSMPESEYRSLVDSMALAGCCKQTILVAYRPQDADKPYVLADGEHRVRACRELGFDVPAVIEDMTDDEIIAWRIGMNKRRGTMNYTMAATEMRDLLDSTSGITADEVMTITGFPDEELQTLLAATSTSTADLLAGANASPPDDGDTQKSFVINLSFTTEADRDRARAALSSASDGGTLGEGMLELIRDD